MRETGWAILPSRPEILSGVIGVPARRGVDSLARLKFFMERLDQLALEWQPRAVAYSQPSGIHWAVPALERLESSLAEWATRNHVPLFAYTAQEVRTAVAGHPNVSKDQLAYQVMAGLGLIGVSKSSHEWEAIAVGRYHLFRRKSRPRPKTNEVSLEAETKHGGAPNQGRESG